jgi:hypothetical protein
MGRLKPYGANSTTMTVTSAEATELLRNTLAIHEDVLLHGAEEIEEEDLGFVYGEGVGRRDLLRILEGIPDDSPAVQVAYLARAIACAQVFNDGNKRTATILADLWLAQKGLRIEASPEDLERLMVGVLERCPSIPLREDALHGVDSALEFAMGWLRNRIVNIN